MMKGECQIPTQCDKFNTHPTANTVRCKLHEQRDEQKDRQNAVKFANEISKTDWREELTLPHKYFGYRAKSNDTPRIFHVARKIY